MKYFILSLLLLSFACKAHVGWVRKETPQNGPQSGIIHYAFDVPRGRKNAVKEIAAWCAPNRYRIVEEFRPTVAHTGSPAVTAFLGVNPTTHATYSPSPLMYIKFSCLEAL